MANILQIKLKPTEKQSYAWKYLKDNSVEYVYFGGGAGCFTGETTIKHSSGYKQIKEVKIGDMVASYNILTKKVEYNKVLETFKYSANHVEHSLIEIKLKDGTQIKSTTNHKYLFNEEWVAIGNIARRSLERYPKFWREISNKQQREIEDIQLEEFWSREDNEPRLSKSNKKTIFGNYTHFKRKDAESIIAQVGGSNFYSKPSEQNTSESHRFQYSKQLCKESKLDEPKRKLPSLEKRRENVGIYGECGKLQELQTYSLKESDIIEFKIYSANESVYDISVENNENYIVTKNNIIVHNSGKSWLGCEWLLTMCLIYPGSKWFMGRNELKRIMTSTYITWLKVCKFHNIPKDIWKINRQENFIEFINFKTRQFDETGSRIDLIDVAWKPSDPLYERFGSIEYTGGFGEEVGEWKAKAFEVLKSRVGRHQPEGYHVPPKIYLTGNPKKNWTYYDFYLAWKESLKNGGDKHIFYMNIDKEIYKCAFIQSLYYDNPYTMKEYERQLKSIKDKVLRQRLKDGNWEYDDDSASLIEYEKILSIFTREFSEELNGNMYISVDAARSGNDKATIILWQGLFIRKVWWEDKSHIIHLGDKIISKANQYRVERNRIVIDEDGVGGGLVDYIEDSIGFVNSSKPVEELKEDQQDTDKYSYLNLRSQCYFKLSEFINAGKIGCYSDIDVEVRNDLIQELEILKRKDYEKNEKKLAVIPKDQIKEIIGRSPDWADNLMMRMYFELGLQANTEISVVW